MQVSGPTYVTRLMSSRSNLALMLGSILYGVDRGSDPHTHHGAKRSQQQLLPSISTIISRCSDRVPDAFSKTGCKTSVGRNIEACWLTKEKLEGCSRVNMLIDTLSCYTDSRHPITRTTERSRCICGKVGLLGSLMLILVCGMLTQMFLT